MNAVDLVVIVLLVIGVAVGFRAGFVVEVAVILGAVVALAVAFVEYSTIRAILTQFVHTSQWVTVISYLLVFVIIWGVIIWVARKVRTVVRFLLLGFFDRLGGAVIGLLQGAILGELFLYLALHVPNHALHHAVRHSRLGPSFLHVVPYLDHLFPHIRA
jgi:membrane protein required for colicin V production